MNVAEQRAGAEGVIAWITGEGSLGDRLMEMGVTPGARVKVLRAGDPMQLMVRDYRLSLRRADAACIELET